MMANQSRERARPSLSETGRDGRKREFFALCFSSSLILGLLLAEARGGSSHPLPDLAMQPLPVLLAPGPEYDRSQRGAQGVAGIERTVGGRLWATWFTGKSTHGVESPYSYVVVATSVDDGRTWVEPKIVIAPNRFVRAFDPCLWIDPRGRMWLFWVATAGMVDGRMGVWAISTEDPDSENPIWSEPRRIGNGIMKNRPTVLRNGDWMLPVGLWRDNDSLPNMALTGEAIAPYTREMLVHDLGEERGSNVFRSRDQGKTFEHIGQARVPPTRVDEHMIVELRDSRLWMLVRTTYGIGQSFSADGGRTWSPGTRYLERGMAVPSTRFFIGRLQSGALLMVRHDGRVTDTRSHLAAFVSDDEGASWTGGLMVDERQRVTYPDCIQAPDGTIYMIYDYERATLDRQGRTGTGSILMATFREEDIRAGRPESDKVRFRVEISRLR